MRPQGVQRGETVEVQIRGARLEDIEELLLYSPGISVEGLEAVNATTVKANFKVAADCRLGIHAMRLRTKTGVSDLKTFTVGALPPLEEVEPNNEFTEPQPIPFDVTVQGVVQSEDVDYFVVEAKQGERIVVEMEGLRLGNTEFDPYVAILNQERFELARSDDASLLFQDCLCALTAPEDGKYVIQVRESAYGGNGNSNYRIHVGHFPRPVAILPAGGRPGESIEVTCIGDVGGPFTRKVTLPTEGDKFELFVENEFGIAPSPNVLRIADLDNFMEVEPNDDRTAASPAAGPGALNGVLEKPGDVDYFKFTAKKGQRYEITVFAREPLRSPLDSVLTVYRANGGRLVTGDDQGRNPDSVVQFNAPADEDYFVEIRDHLGAGGPRYVYRIEIAPSKPSLVMNIPERRRYVATTLTVPSGNRMAMMVNARRTGFRGELAVELDGLPEGMTYQALPMADNRNDTAILFTAAPGAKTGGALAGLIGRTTDDQNIVGKLDQRTMLVRGQGNNDVWGHNAERLAVSLAEAIPYSVEIVQPKVPLVRDGSMNLKVVARRDEGFTGPINLRMLYNPPGIGASTSIKIEEGQTEASIPLTANGNATIQTWPIIVLATARHGDGTVEASTQVAELEVADRFFDLAIQKSAVELNQEGVVVVNVAKKVDFPETAEVELLGLPAGTAVVSETPKFTQDSTEFTFRVKAEETARPNTYKSLVCKATLVRNGEPITTTIGGGELRVDKPLPPKVAAPAKPAEKKPEVQKPAEPAKKVLTRLEQLRLEKAKELEKQQGE
ncbi:MAG: PPC domain-containing protein [Pirellulaceae bacterium]